MISIIMLAIGFGLGWWCRGNWAKVKKFFTKLGMKPSE